VAGLDLRARVLVDRLGDIAQRVLDARESTVVGPALALCQRVELVRQVPQSLGRVVVCRGVGRRFEPVACRREGLACHDRLFDDPE
jgi:hypothetical protein